MNKLFSMNEGVGGFEEGEYDLQSSHPVNSNWTRNSRFNCPTTLNQIIKIESKDAYVGQNEDRASFVVDKNKNIYVVENNNICKSEYRKGKLIKINPNGDIVELYKSQVTLKSPIIGRDGILYLTTDGDWDSTGHKVICLTLDGEVKWEYTTDYQAFSSLILDSDGNIYLYAFHEDEGKLISLSKDGTLNWQRDFKDYNWSNPVISKEGIIYIGFSISRTICALNKKGELLWQKPFKSDVEPSGISIHEDGTLYICQANILYALNPDCSIRWIYKPSEGSIFHVPAIDKNGNLYLNTMPFGIVSLDKNGNELWKHQIQGQAFRPPVIGTNGILYQESFKKNSPNYNSWIETFSIDGTRLDTYEMKGTILSTILVEDELLYSLNNIYTYKKRGWKDKMDVRWEFHVIGNV